MRSLKKTIIGLMIAALAGTMIYGTVLAEEPQTQAAPEAGRTFVSTDGVLSIRIPQDDDNWMVIDDPGSWFTLGDGKDLITARHLAAGDTLPQAEMANEHYEEIFQMFYSTQGEVFVITGKVADKAEAQIVKDAIASFKVLKYGEIQKKEEAAAAQPQPVYAVRDISETRYCTEKDGVNVRSGYTTADPVIGGFHYGDQVAVTGIVTRDGADTGWIRVNYNGQAGYTVAQFYSTTKPGQNPDGELINGGQIFTGYKMSNLINVDTGEYVTLSELSQGGWANELTGEIFTQEGGGGPHMYGDKGTVLMFADQYFGDYDEDEEFDEDENELINGGQIFTGYTMSNLINVDTGEYVTLSELSQGGWADEITGELFTQEGGGGPHMYGDRGTVLMFEDQYYAQDSEEDDAEEIYEEDYEEDED